MKHSTVLVAWDKGKEISSRRLACPNFRNESSSFGSVLTAAQLKPPIPTLIYLTTGSIPAIYRLTRPEEEFESMLRRRIEKLETHLPVAAGKLMDRRDRQR
jgi:hypothetical protein